MSVVVGAGVSGAGDPVVAAIEACGEALAALGGRRPDLAVLFVSGSHVTNPGVVLEVLDSSASPVRTIGCCAGGVLGGGRELERANAVAIWLAAWDENPGIEAFRVDPPTSDDDFLDPIDALPDGLGSARGMIVLADGGSHTAAAVLDALAAVAPAVPVVGGLASARARDGGTLFLDRDLHEGGAVGIAFRNAEMLACVSQGAIPIGRELTVTRADGDILHELAGRPALDALQEVVAELTPSERALVGNGLLLGLVIGPAKPDYGQGDFLVRGIVGVDRDSGALRVAAQMREGQILRLHVRDAISADEDLVRTLALQREAVAGLPPAGALVFSCNGRGTSMFGVGDHDAATVHRELAGAPSAGFFAAGEIGPVAGRNFLHGFSATVAVFPV